ncbi:MAG TPA: hypothetical protein VF646_05610 [Cytophagales bacterium]|jgi:hypothetical protein
MVESIGQSVTQTALYAVRLRNLVLSFHYHETPALFGYYRTLQEAYQCIMCGVVENAHPKGTMELFYFIDLLLTDSNPFAYARTGAVTQRSVDEVVQSVMDSMEKQYGLGLPARNRVSLYHQFELIQYALLTLMPPRPDDRRRAAASGLITRLIDCFNGR